MLQPFEEKHPSNSKLTKCSTSVLIKHLLLKHSYADTIILIIILSLPWLDFKGRVKSHQRQHIRYYDSSWGCFTRKVMKKGPSFLIRKTFSIRLCPKLTICFFVLFFIFVDFFSSFFFHMVQSLSARANWRRGLAR